MSSFLVLLIILNLGLFRELYEMVIGASNNNANFVFLVEIIMLPLKDYILLSFYPSFTVVYCIICFRVQTCVLPFALYGQPFKASMLVLAILHPTRRIYGWVTAQVFVTCICTGQARVNVHAWIRYVGLEDCPIFAESWQPVPLICFYRQFVVEFSFQI